MTSPSFDIDFPFEQWFALRDIIDRFPSVISKDYEDFRAFGERSAKDLLRQQIYDTPSRGYVRTGKLLSSMSVTAQTPNGNLVLSFRNTARSRGGFPYAIVNELGNIQGKRDGKTILSVQEVRDLSRQRVNNNATPPRLRYPREAGVLEPRPFAFPAAAATERRVFARLSERVQELGRKI